jgi:hypothetical protein
MRSDPLGVQALFESLKKMPDGGAERNFSPPKQVRTDNRTTLVLCGLRPRWMHFGQAQWKPLADSIASRGGRLVLVFASKITCSTPENQKTEDVDPCPDGNDEAEDCSSNDDPSAGKEEPPESWESGLEVLSRSVAVKTLEARIENPPGGLANGREHLSASLPWRSQLYFRLADPGWEVVYTAADEPVVARRTWGRGTLVAVADSYLFSNEALRNQRATAFLAWVVAPGNRVVFDEFHHGLAKQPGIAALMRKYRLHGVLLTLLILVMLALWRQSAIFVPMAVEEIDDGGSNAIAKDSAEGWVGLLQQNIAAKDLLDVCYRAWSESTAANQTADAQVSQVGRLIATHQTAQQRSNIVAVYRSICELLKQGRTP